MSSLIELFRLLYPFLQEFGLKEVNIKEFIVNNKTISYLFMTCILLFVMFIYGLEQAHLRMLYRTELLKEQAALIIDIESKDKVIEQLQILCAENDAHNSTDAKRLNVEESLNELMGKEDEK